MRCPHCHRSIEPRRRYTMELRKREEGEPLIPLWAWWMTALVLLFVFALSVLVHQGIL